MKEKKGTVRLTIKCFKEIVSAHKAAGILFPLLKYVLSFVNVYEIFLMGELLDSISDFLQNNDTFEIDNLLNSDVARYTLILISITLVTSILNKIIGYLNTLISDMFWYSFTRKSIHRISNLNLEDIEKSDLQNLMTSVPSYSWSSMLDSYRKVTDMGYHIIKFVSTGYIILTQMAWWGLIVFVLQIPEVLYRYRKNKQLKEFRDKNISKQKYFNYIYSQSQVINNFPELRVDNIFDFFLKSFKRTALPYCQEQNQIRLGRDIGAAVLSWFDSSIKRIVQMALIPIAVVERYSIGTFKYLFDYIDNLYSSGWNVFWNTFCLKNNAMYIKDYFDFVEYKGFGDIVSGTEKLDPIKIPKIELLNVEFKYPQSPSAALNGISFSINPGEKVSIIGHDNSGKSTIAKLLCGLYKVGPGDILIDEISIKNLSRGELKDKVAVVFENYIKYNFSIRKNIVVAEPERDFNKRRYEEALEITGLDKWMKEEGIKDSQVLGKLFGDGMDVSTGHWQRIAIARAIYRDRAVLILDESFTQIDGFSRRPILEKIIEHRPKQTFINITQEETELSLFDKLIYLEKGKITKIVEKE